MDFEKGPLFEKFKWHIVAVGAALVVLILLGIFTGVFWEAEVPLIIWLLTALILLTAVITALAKLIDILETLTERRCTSRLSLL